jgi:hypothetical protein
MPTCGPSPVAGAAASGASAAGAAASGAGVAAGAGQPATASMATIMTKNNTTLGFLRDMVSPPEKSSENYRHWTTSNNVWKEKMGSQGDQSPPR